jgi:hypothetical protein
MSLKNTFSIGLLFFTSILCGMLIGSKARLMIWETHEEPTEILHPAMENGQINVLIIITDRLDQKDLNLESIWLVNYHADDAPLKVFPIYPSQSDVEITDYKNLAKSFNLSEKNGLSQLNPKFVKILRNRNFSWGGFIVIDKYALGNLVDILGGINISGARLTGRQFYQYLPHSTDNPRLAYDYYASFWQELCLSGKLSLSGLSWERSVGMLPEHIATDIMPSYLFEAWRDFFFVEKLAVCEFPLTDKAESVRQTIHFSPSSELIKPDNP